MITFHDVPLSSDEMQTTSVRWKMYYVHTFFFQKIQLKSVQVNKECLLMFQLDLQNGCRVTNNQGTITFEVSKRWNNKPKVGPKSKPLRATNAKEMSCCQTSKQRLPFSCQNCTLIWVSFGGTSGVFSHRTENLVVKSFLTHKDNGFQNLQQTVNSQESNNELEYRNKKLFWFIVFNLMRKETIN